MIAGKRFYGDDVDDADEEAKIFRELQAESTRLTGISNIGDFVPMMTWLGFGWSVEKKMMDCHYKRDAFMQSLIEEQRKRSTAETESEIDDSFRDGRKKTMIEVLLELQESEPDHYTDESIKALMLVILSLSHSHLLHVHSRIIGLTYQVVSQTFNCSLNLISIF